MINLDKRLLHSCCSFSFFTSRRSLPVPHLPTIGSHIYIEREPSVLRCASAQTSMRPQHCFSQEVLRNLFGGGDIGSRQTRLTRTTVTPTCRATAHNHRITLPSPNSEDRHESRTKGSLARVKKAFARIVRAPQNLRRTTA